jgi:hypothetical protein
MLTLRVELAASLGKDPQRPELIEDVFAISEKVARAAIADGASESYDSGKWAKLLAHAFVLEPNVSPRWLQTLVSYYTSQTDFDALSWSAQAAFERGSFSTLLGIELLPEEHAVRVLAVGDSIALQTRQQTIVTAFPFNNPDTFACRPELLSTKSRNNVFFTEPFVSRSWTRWQLYDGDNVYLMTDAVGEWILKGGAGTNLRELELVRTYDDFAELVLWLRRVRRIRLDDSTLIRMSVVETD